MSSEDLTDTPLHEAVHIGDVEDVRTALKGGYDPNQIGLYLWSPVHEAAHNGDEHILKLLLKHKGNPNQPDLLKGCTSVHYAASQGHKECLQLLVDAGGRYDTLNKDGQTCLDVATENCASILRLQRNEDLIITPRNVIVANILKDTEPLKSDPAKSHPNPCVCEEPDEDISVTSGESQSETHIPRAWDPGTVFGLKKELVLGRVQLSFEYNSKTSSLKIRVWQVTDLLLPPANSSMINSIFVKGYLLPDKKKDSKRKTEEVKVDRDDNGSSTKSKQSGQTIFKISSFKFTKPLEYKNIKPDVIDTRMVQIDVCITQKYTRKNFVIATWNLPLKMAVKKLVREKFALKPCISRNIPANMKVYSANELSVMYTSRHFDSNPNLRYPSLSSLISSQNERSSSDPDLKGVTVQPVPNTPSIVVSLSPEDIHTTAGNWPDKVRVVGQLQPTTE